MIKAYVRRRRESGGRDLNEETTDSPGKQKNNGLSLDVGSRNSRYTGIQVRIKYTRALMRFG